MGKKEYENRNLQSWVRISANFGGGWSPWRCLKTVGIMSDHLFSTCAKFSKKTNISYLLICIRTCAYQAVRNVSFSEDFAYLLNEWSLGYFFWLTHFSPMFHSCTLGFLTFSAGIEVEHWIKQVNIFCYLDWIRRFTEGWHHIDIRLLICNKIHW